MSKHIKEFKNESEYQAFKESAEYAAPNLSWCREENAIKLESFIKPPHDYVEIGGIKWATMNVGATAVTDSGLYFQWGDTQGYTIEQCGSGEGKKYFGWADYEWVDHEFFDGTSEPEATDMTKYGGEVCDGLLTLEASDDAVHAAWGGKWRMPTSAETAALIAAVTTAWTSNYEGSGVAGMVCTDKTDTSKVLFFPAAGYCRNGSVTNLGATGLYWSSSLYDLDIKSGYFTYFTSEVASWNYTCKRHFGLTVRGILDE